MSEFELMTRYGISKQVPCIEQEAVFETNYGQLRLTESESKQVAKLVKRLLEKRLTRKA